MKRFLCNERGVSLVEILVVLVILMVGIISAIRVFPIGFGVIQHSSDLSIASRFAQRELASWSADFSCLPHAILPYDLNYGDPNRENFNEFYQIYEESTVVPAVYNEGMTGDVKIQDWPAYLFRLGPIRYSNQYPIYIRTGALEQSALNDDPYSPSWQDLITPETNPTVQDLQKYQIDSSQLPSLYFRKTPYDTYLDLEYDYIDTAGTTKRRLHFSTPAPVLLTGTPFPDTGTGDVIKFELPHNSNFGNLVPGTLKVYRALEVITSDHPDSPFTYSIQNTDFGIVRFNPQLQGTRVYINYYIQDWRILHEDVRVDENNMIRTTIPFIVDPDSADSIRNGYELISGSASSGAIAFAIPIGGISMDATGSTPQEATIPGNPFLIDQSYWTDQSQRKQDLRNGILRCNPDWKLRGCLVRVYYRCEGQWALHLSRASDKYYEAHDNVGFHPSGMSNELIPQYYRFVGVNNLGDSFDIRLELPRCDLKKTILADIRLLDKDGHVVKNCPDTLIKINDSKDPATNNAVAIVNVAAPAEATTVEVDNIRGISLKVQVNWKENDRTKIREVNTVLDRIQNL